MSAVCGVFLFAFLFSLPGAWIRRDHLIWNRKTILGIFAVALFGIAGNYVGRALILQELSVEVQLEIPAHCQVVKTRNVPMSRAWGLHATTAMHAL